MRKVSALVVCLGAILAPTTSTLLRGSYEGPLHGEQGDLKEGDFKEAVAKTSQPPFSTTQYVAAVAQHESQGSSVDYSPSEIIALNLREYDSTLASSTSLGAQIVVFPEWGLFGSDNVVSSRNTLVPYCEVIPEPDSSTPLTDPSSTVGQLAALAAKHSVVVVANVCEVVKSQGSALVYNTEVALSETGALLAKYHKNHPWYTDTFDTPPHEEIVTFTTSFGVRFGLFICYDIAHLTPVRDLLEEGINQFPYSVAFPVQEMEKIGFRAWSQKTKATLLASNLGDSGSGIFQKGDIIASVGRTNAKFAIGPVVVDVRD